MDREVSRCFASDGLAAGLERNQRQRGLGNRIFLPQATSQVTRVLPPPAEDLQTHFSFVLVDCEKTQRCQSFVENKHIIPTLELPPGPQDVDSSSPPGL